MTFHNASTPEEAETAKVFTEADQEVRSQTPVSPRHKPRASATTPRSQPNEVEQWLARNVTGTNSDLFKYKQYLSGRSE